MRLKFGLLLCAAGGLLATAAAAQSWPTKPVRIIVGFNAGTSPDLVARLTGAEIAKRIGQPLLVEARPGAGGLLAVRAVAQSSPDGYTILHAGSMINAHPIFVKEEPLVVGKDMSPIADVATNPYVFIARTSVAKTWPELLEYSKKNPNKLNFGSQTTQIDAITEMVKLKSGFSFTPIRYKGAPLAELLRGEVDFYVGSMNGLAEHIKAGRVVPVLSFAKITDFPSVPTVTELGYLNASVSSIFGFYGPRNLPRDIVQKFAQAARETATSPEIMESLRKMGLDPFYQGPDEQLRQYQAMIGVFTEAARILNIQPE